MKASTVRALTYSVVALLGVTALRFTPRLPQQKLPGEMLTAAPPVREPQWRQRDDTLGRGETLAALLQRGGLPTAEVVAALRAATQLDMRRVPAGLRVTLRGMDTDSMPSEVVLHLAVDRVVRLTRTATGWVQSEERLPWTTDTITVAGAITSTLYGAVDSGARDLLTPRARAELAWTLADIYEYRVDMSRDLQPGDGFRALVERQRAPNGAVRLGDVLAASFSLSGSEVQAIRFKSGRVAGDYFDAEGKSMRAAFLRAPLAFRRVSSVFGMRRHPILGTMRKHKGTDYAAASGTPVRSVGDGVVVRANYNRGYGNVLEIRHRNGFVSRYAHLRGFARGVRPGRRVSIGETVAYVGSTGLSTAPHLHFEVLVGGVQRDPRTALRTRGGEPIPATERAQFEELRTRLIASLEQPLSPERLATLE